MNYEQLLRDGITAAKNGQHRLAQSLLRQASIIKSNDARPYVWLSATTDDPEERREYLEQAVIIEPANVAARRGLAILQGKASPKAEPAPAAGPALDAPADAPARFFQCPQCGGRVSYLAGDSAVRCEHCGEEYSEIPEPPSDQPLWSAADRLEQPLDFVVPTPAGERWALAERRVVCEQCGAVSILPPGQASASCPYCGSNAFLHSPPTESLIEPHLVGLMKLDEEQARECARAWLGEGWFAPDDLHRKARRLELRPAYYSCWTFDGALEVPWSCHVNVGSSRQPQWVARNGRSAEFFDDVIVSGVKEIKAEELEKIGPHASKDLREFKPEYLAGWPAVLYDRPINDASLLAREQVAGKIGRRVEATVEPGKEKRDFRVGAGRWSGLTFKHILLPLWVGSYQYGGKNYRVLVNGQTGKVTGSRPLDRVKVVLSVAAVLLTTALLVVLVFLALSFTGDL